MANSRGLVGSAREKAVLDQRRAGPRNQSFDALSACSAGFATRSVGSGNGASSFACLTRALFAMPSRYRATFFAAAANPLPPRTGRTGPPYSLDGVFRDDAPALELRGLTKRYDDGTLALENFDLEIPAGAFFGLLGPNGAGQTTLISAVCNLIRVSGGEIRVFGEAHDTLEARSWIGLAEQDINLDRFLTVRETLLYHGGYFGMREPEERAEELIDVFGLRHKRDVRAPKLSGGQRRRLLLARALMHRPRLVILDEPTAGV